MLKISNLSVKIDGKEVLTNINLNIENGIHVILGHNGSGKSTLFNTIIGNKACEITSGSIIFNDTDITTTSISDRANLGIFLGFQSPVEIPGISNTFFISEILKARAEKEKKKYDRRKTLQAINEFVSKYLLPEKLIDAQGVNSALSGGEKKYNEMLQMLMLNPKLALLDEIDSGLDVDGTKTIAKILTDRKNEDPKSTSLIITHYNDFAEKLKPSAVHILSAGKIVYSGDVSVIKQIKESGFEKFKS